MKKLLFVVDPLDQFKVYKDTTFSIMREAQWRGYLIAACLPQDIQWKSGGFVMATVQQISLTGSQPGWYRVHNTMRMALKDFDAVLMRKDPPFNAEYIYATHLLEQAEREDGNVVNRPRALRDHPEKLAIMEFPELVPPTLVTRNAASVRDFHAEHGDIILKQFDCGEEYVVLLCPEQLRLIARRVAGLDALLDPRDGAAGPGQGAGPAAGLCRTGAHGLEPDRAGRPDRSQASGAGAGCDGRLVG